MPFKTNALLKVCLLACLSLLHFSLFAQKTVTGRVIGNTDKQPIVGATVQVKGSKVATSTGADGSFSISAKDNSTLVISSVGFEKQEFPVSGRSAIGDVTLVTSTSALNEIVVTGYSSQKKKDITGSVAVVDVKSLRSVPGGNTEALLQGQASGVTVISSGTPGGGSNVRIRGITSFGNSDPLVIIDGVQIPNGLHDLNSADIESIQVLKDAGAAAIYGVRGSNGVVIVTTKKGRSGKAVITYDGYVGTQRPLSGNVFNIANPTESANALYAEFKNSGLPFNATNFKNSQYGYGPTPVLYDYLTPINTNNGGPNTDPSTYALYSNQITKTDKSGNDWFHQIFKPAMIQSHTLSASGGSDRSQYFFSFNYFNQQGTLLDTYLKRYSARINTVFNVKDHIRVGENAYIFYRQSPSGIPGSSNQNEGNAISMSYRMSPIIPTYDVVGNYAGTQVKGLGNPQNPVAALQRSANNKNNDYQITGNVFAEVDLLKHLTVRTSFGGNIENFYNTSFSYTAYENTENNTNPNTFTEASGYNSSWTWTNTIKYNNTWGDHNVTVLGGVEAISNYQRAMQATRSGYYVTNPAALTVDPSLWVLNFGPPAGQTNSSTVNNSEGIGINYPIQSSIYSMFGRIDYSYKERYLLSGTLRRDGSSIFASDVRFGVFPSVTAGWRISQEDFLKDVDWISDLKLRGGWGKLGSLSNALSTNRYTLFGQAAASSSYDIGGTSTSSVLGSYSSQNGNAAGSWERDKVLNIGVDGSIIKNKFDFSVEWYKKDVSGLLFNAPIAATGGNATAAFFNTGDVENKGVDASVTWHGTAVNRELKFDITGTFSTYTNKVISLADGVKYQDKVSEGSNRFGAFSRLQPGQPVGEFFGYQVVGLFQDANDVSKSPVQPDAAPGRFKYADVNHSGTINDSDRTFFGNPNPKFVAGLNIAASYKNFDFSAFFYASVGNKVINYVKYWTDFPQVFDAALSKDAALHSFGMPGANGKTPILERSANFSNSTQFNSYYQESGSYLRCKQLQIGYSLPSATLKRVGIDRFRVYIQAANLFTITKYSGLDPELTTSKSTDNTNFGIDFGNYPANQKNYNIGVQLGF
ncbi:MAG TPA: TonB-dependent receptor [Puia sp.]|nr:TonB-dependent receptor [Puia sp.]